MRAPAATATSLTVPAAGASTSFSIFIASMMRSTSPSFTCCPGATSTRMMRPVIREVMAPAPPGGAGRLGPPGSPPPGAPPRGAGRAALQLHLVLLGVHQHLRRPLGHGRQGLHLVRPLVHVDGQDVALADDPHRVVSAADADAVRSWLDLELLPVDGDLHQRPLR